MVDAQFTPELAEQLLAEIEASTDSPVSTLVVTHPNPDKFNGASVFQAAGAELVASASTAEAMPGVHAYKQSYFESVGMFEPGTYPELPQVDRSFDGALALDLPGLDEPIVLRELSHGGVSTTQTVVLLGDEVIVGDLVAARAHAWLEGGIVEGVASPELESWRLALEELQELVGPEATVHAGRGPRLPAAEVLPERIAYLQDAEDIVAEAIEGLEDPVATLSGAESGAFYEAITQELAAAWPEHEHAYLVTYGVYGLAWDLASR